VVGGPSDPTHEVGSEGPGRKYRAFDFATTAIGDSQFVDRGHQAQSARGGLFYWVAPAQIGVTMSTDKPARAEAATSSIAVLRRVDVCEALGVSTWTLDRWVRQGLFPSPIFLTPASNVGMWRLRDVESFLEKRRRARRVKPKPRGIFRQRRTRAVGGDDA
jgi:predicted DNA-binding transcriptional regulator AlpA